MATTTPTQQTDTGTTTVALDWQQRQNVRNLALVSIICTLWYAGISAFMLLPQLSSYASDPSFTTTIYLDYYHAGFFIFLGYLALGGSALTLAGALSRAVSAAGRSRAGLYLLCLVSIGYLLIALFPDDAPDGPVSARGTVHTVAALVALVCTAVAPLLLARGFRNDAHWRGYASISLVLGVLAVAALIFALVRLGFPVVTTSLGVFSVAAVPLAVVTLLWLLLTALRVRRTILA